MKILNILVLILNYTPYSETPFKTLRLGNNKEITTVLKNVVQFVFYDVEL